MGEVQIMTFLNDNVTTQVSIILDGKERTPSDEGLFLELPVGRHAATVYYDQKRQKHDLEFSIQRDQVTQVFINLYSSKQPDWVVDVGVEGAKQSVLGPEQGDLKDFVILKGKVVSYKDQSAVAGVRIIAKGTPYSFRSDHKGYFELKMPSGIHSFALVHPDFVTQALNEIPFSSKSPTQNEIKVELTPAGLALEEFVVLAPHVQGSLAALIEIRKTSKSVADVLGAEQMSRAGDSDAASSLKRVTGLSVVDGKYVYVRGLGERYSSSLFNGALMPSPEPTRKVVPLDMFPSEMIESMIIQKSYSSDMPAEFGGGTVMIQTKGLPEKKVAKISTSIQYGGNSANGLVPGHEGGGQDWIGKDDGTRAIPQDLQQILNGKIKLDEISPELRKSIGLQMNRDFSPQYQKMSTIPKISFVYGDVYKGPQLKWGGLLSGLYGQDPNYRQKKSVRYNYTKGKAEVSQSYDYNIYENEIDTGLMLTLGAHYLKDHQLKINSMILRKTLDETRISMGHEKDNNGSFRNDEFRWIERQLLTTQFVGTHKIDEVFTFGWNYTLSQARRYEPDHKLVRYEITEEGKFQYNDGAKNNMIYYMDLEDQGRHLNLDLIYEFPFIHELSKAKFKLGHSTFRKDRVFQVNRFNFIHQNIQDVTLATLQGGSDGLFHDDNIGQGQFILQDKTLPTDNYDAFQTVDAWYALAEIPIFSDLSLSAGMRRESSRQYVKTYNLYDQDNPANIADLYMDDDLPAYSLFYNPLKPLVFRIGYSETISRPDLKELSTAPYWDEELDLQINGNDQLMGSVIKNSDYRAEWYFDQKDLVAVSYFQKEFDRPIVMVFENSTEGNKATYKNAKNAEVKGFEFELRKDFAFAGIPSWSLGGNYTTIESFVNLSGTGGVNSSLERPLTGQSPYVWNVQLAYDQEKWGSKATLLYNVFGPRIRLVGQNNDPDIYEQPFHQLDFNFSQELGKYLSAKFIVKNIIDPEVHLTQGPYVLENYRKGRSVGVGLTGTF